MDLRVDCLTGELEGRLESGLVGGHKGGFDGDIEGGLEGEYEFGLRLRVEFMEDLCVGGLNGGIVGEIGLEVYWRVDLV